MTRRSMLYAQTLIALLLVAIIMLIGLGIYAHVIIGIEVKIQDTLNQSRSDETSILIQLADQKRELTNIEDLIQSHQEEK